MSTATLQCVIRSRGGGEVKKVAEVVGEGRSYLASLSDNLSRMQSEVNAYLTEQVEKEKGEKTGSTAPPRRGSSDRSSSEDEGMCVSVRNREL